MTLNMHCIFVRRAHRHNSIIFFLPCCLLHLNSRSDSSSVWNSSTIVSITHVLCRKTREKLFIFKVFLVFMKMSENYSKNNIFDHKMSVQKKFLKNSSISALVHFMHLSTWLMDRYFELFDGSVHGYDILWWWTSSIIMLAVAYMVSLTLCATNWLKSLRRREKEKFYGF